MRLIHDDCLRAMAGLPSGSVDLVLTDPPYYRVKDDSWDRQWSSEADFLAWLDSVVVELVRVLKPNGSLYLFAGPHMAFKVEKLIRERLKLLNHIVWAKPTGRHLGCRKSDLRRYFPRTEHIFFAEPAGADGGYNATLQNLRKDLFAPVVAELNRHRLAAGVSVKDCCALVGSSAVSHYFQTSQFQFPPEDRFIQLMTAFGKSPSYADMAIRYQDLQQRYQELKAQYESARRVFNGAKSRPYTNVWECPVVQSYPGKHPCEKPLQMIKDMIETSSLPGQVVLDPFMGSGVTGAACVELGREFIGVELDAGYFAAVERRLLPDVRLVG